MERFVRVFGGVGTLLLAAAALAEPLAVVGGRVIDGTGRPPLVDGVVLIENGRISAVGRAGSVEIPPGTQIVDADGSSVLPGLIDVHVHFDIVGHADYDYWFPTYERRMRSDILPAAARAMLDAGVTSVRDLGSDVDNIFWLREQINSGALPGPRTFIAGPFLRKTRTAFVPESYVDTWVVEGPADARRKVRELVALGVDVVKTQDEALSRAELAAIYEEAHALGKRVASHIYSPEGIRTALRAGLGAYDTIEHIGDNAEPAYADDIVAAIVAQEVAMAPTIVALEGIRQISRNPELTDDPRWRQFLPDDIYRDIRRSYREVDMTQHPLYRRATLDRPGRMAKLRQLYQAGAIFAVSSDSGTRGNPHHDAMWREMVLTQEATGMTAMAVIVAATRTNARILQREAELGTLEPGKLGDVIVVEGDPLTYLADMRRVKHVIKGGELVR